MPTKALQVEYLRVGGRLQVGAVSHSLKSGAGIRNHAYIAYPVLHPTPHPAPSACNLNQVVEIPQAHRGLENDPSRGGTSAEARNKHYESPTPFVSLPLLSCAVASLEEETP